MNIHGLELSTSRNESCNTSLLLGTPGLRLWDWIMIRSAPLRLDLEGRLLSSLSVAERSGHPAPCLRYRDSVRQQGLSSLSAVQTACSPSKPPHRVPDQGGISEVSHI